jgi:hypothetical protein
MAKTIARQQTIPMFTEVTWQDGTLPLEDAVQHWPQQMKACSDRPDFTSLLGGISVLISTQWDILLCTLKRSHCIGPCSAKLRVHMEVSPVRDIVPPKNGLPKSEMTTSESPEANIYTAEGHRVATTTQAGITDLMQLHHATAPEMLQGKAALQDTISLYNRHRVTRTDTEKQATEKLSHRWRLCPQSLSTSLQHTL